MEAVSSASLEVGTDETHNVVHVVADSADPESGVDVQAAFHRQMSAQRQQSAKRERVQSDESVTTPSEGILEVWDAYCKQFGPPRRAEYLMNWARNNGRRITF